MVLPNSAAVSLVLGLVGCAAPESPETGCDGLCGDGRVQAVSSLSLLGRQDDGRVPGFDLDGVNGDPRPDCRAPDYTAPDGTPGIDDQLVSVLPVIIGFAGEAFPTLLQNSVNAGGVGIVVERVVDGGRLFLVFHKTAGVPLLGADSRLLPDQTFTLAGEEVLGTCADAKTTGNTVECGPFDLRVSATIFQFTYTVHLRNARVRLTDDPATGGTTMLVGGGLPVPDVLAIADTINVESLGDLVRDLVPPFADLTNGPDGECEWISATVRLETRPGFSE